jgi:hypothetical protein
VGAALPAQETRARIRLPGFRDPFPIEEITVQFELKAPMGKAFDAVTAAFEDLKLPTVVSDRPKGLLGNTKIQAMVNMAGHRLSRVFDCGSKSTTQNADSYRLSIVFLALLDSVNATHTTLRVGLVASGEPQGGSIGQAVTCASSGLLEQELFEHAQNHVR